MSPDWLLISCVASFLVACGLGFMLWICRQADKTFDRINDEIESERSTRYAEHRPCPWDLKP